MKYFNSTKVADSRKKVRAPFTTGYAQRDDLSKKEQKRIDREREWNKAGADWEKEMLLEKLQYGDSYYYRW